MAIISLQLRIVLFVGSVAVFLLIAQSIRRKKILMKDGIFWILFGFLLVLVSIFPSIAVWAAQILGIQSPSNCVFMIIIFLLGCHAFFLTIRVSQLEMKMTKLIQKIAIEKELETEEKKDEKEDLLLLR